MSTAQRSLHDWMWRLRPKPPPPALHIQARMRLRASPLELHVSPFRLHRLLGITAALQQLAAVGGGGGGGGGVAAAPGAATAPAATAAGAEAQAAGLLAGSLSAAAEPAWLSGAEYQTLAQVSTAEQCDIGIARSAGFPYTGSHVRTR